MRCALRLKREASVALYEAMAILRSGFRPSMYDGSITEAPSDLPVLRWHGDYKAADSAVCKGV